MKIHVEHPILMAITVVLAIVGIVVLVRLRYAHEKKEKKEKDEAEEKPKQAKAAPPPIQKVEKRIVVEKKSSGESKVPLITGLALVAGIIALLWFFNREPNDHPPVERKEPVREASTDATRTVHPATALVNALIPKASPCGGKVEVKAPISLDNSQWSDFVEVPPQCRPVPSIAHETGLYRYRCKDKDGQGPFEEETGKCAAGVTAYSFQKRSPNTKEGEETPADQYFAPLELTLTFEPLG